MNIGDFDRRITIQTFTVAKNTEGEDIRTWSTLITLWAKKIDTSGNEMFEADQLTAIGKIDWIIRYRTDITERMRISFDSEYYDVLNIEEIEEEGRKRYLLLKTEKKY